MLQTILKTPRFLHRFLPRDETVLDDGDILGDGDIPRDGDIVGDGNEPG